MRILAIETSCDDTCVALIETSDKAQFKILSNIVSSQVKLHAKYGGVYPFLAKREHQKNLPIILKKVVKRNAKIDLIAVTTGPGLEPCLWVGVNFAEKLAQDCHLPIITVNHIEAHILANWLNPVKLLGKPSRAQFPAICLVVSGGHTQLILMRDFGKYKILGETRDDAAGECFDKVARILGLGYPGGPAVAAQAKSARGQASGSLPRPMIYQKNYDFSFSGLKTAVLYNFRSQPSGVRETKRYIQEMAASVQQAIIDVLIHKTIKAIQEYKARTLILGGGVVANEELKKQFKSRVYGLKSKVNFLVPPENLCTDNEAMVAVTGYYHWLKGEKKNWKNIKAEANSRIK